MTRRLVLLAVVLLAATATLNADIMFDRGLPVSNLNNIAGANRSNVAWGYWCDPTLGCNYSVGDTFNLNKPGTYDVTDIRTWMIGTDSEPLSSMWSNLTLYLGDVSGNIDHTSTVETSGDPHAAISAVTYADGSSYQNSSGTFDTIYQVDFLLNWALDGQTTYTFFVGGTPAAENLTSYPYHPVGAYGPGVSPFLLSTNKALSDNCGGCTQEGADNQMYYLGYSGGSVTDFGTWDSSVGGWWDKSSDVNVEVFVPEPSAVTLLMVMFGAVGFIGFTLRRRLSASR